MSAFGLDMSTGAFFDVVTDFDSRVLYHSRTGNKIDKPTSFQVTGCRHRRNPMSVWQAIYKGRGFIDERMEFVGRSCYFDHPDSRYTSRIDKTINIWT